MSSCTNVPLALTHQSLQSTYRATLFTGSSTRTSGLIIQTLFWSVLMNLLTVHFGEEFQKTSDTDSNKSLMKIVSHQHVTWATTLADVLYLKDRPETPWFLSQHNFGWPCHRPRSYCLLTRNDRCHLSEEGLQEIHALFRKPNLSASDLFCAPQDWFNLGRSYLLTEWSIQISFV